MFHQLHYHRLCFSFSLSQKNDILFQKKYLPRPGFLQQLLPSQPSHQVTPSHQVLKVWINSSVQGWPMKVGGFNYKSTCYVLAQRSKVWTPQVVAGGGSVCWWFGGVVVGGRFGRFFFVEEWRLRSQKIYVCMMFWFSKWILHFEKMQDVRLIRFSKKTTLDMVSMYHVPCTIEIWMCTDRFCIRKEISRDIDTFPLRTW